MQRNVDRLPGVEVGDDAAGERQRVIVVGRHVVGDAGFPRVHLGAAEVLGRDHLAGGGLHQRRAAEEDGALPFDDDALVAHRRHIGAAGGAGAHHHGDLRNAERGQRRLVVEDAAEVLAVREHLGLVRQVGAAGIDQVDARQPVLARDLLGAQVLLHRHRIVGAALDGGVVADDHAFAAFDAADAGDQAGAVDGVVVHAAGGKRRQFQERAAGIDQAHHAFAWKKFSARPMAFADALGPARGGLGAPRLQLFGQRAHARGVGGEFPGSGVDGGFDRQGGLPTRHSTLGRREGNGSSRSRRASARGCGWVRRRGKSPARLRYSAGMARRDQISAGLLAFRRRPQPEFLLAHPGGPFWARKDLGAWTIPKGLVRPDDLLAGALREFTEETEFHRAGPVHCAQPGPAEKRQDRACLRLRG